MRRKAYKSKSWICQCYLACILDSNSSQFNLALFNPSVTNFNSQRFPLLASLSQLWNISMIQLHARGSPSPPPPQHTHTLFLCHYWHVLGMLHVSMLTYLKSSALGFPIISCHYVGRYVLTLTLIYNVFTYLQFVFPAQLTLSQPL